MLLFFRYGITPTANKLYQYVRKGSMSAPAEALNTFWVVLREKSRVRIERPDLPEQVKDAAGSFAASLWKQAQEAAQARFSAQIAESNEKVLEARQESDIARKELATILLTLQETQAHLENANQRIAEIEKKHAVDISTLATFEKSFESLQNERVNLDRSLEATRTGFSRDIEIINVALSKAEERYRLLEAKSLMEVDRERQRASKLEKELIKIRETTRTDQVDQQKELFSLQNVISGLREKLGTLNGQLNAVTSQQKETTRRLRFTEKKLEASSAKNSRIKSMP
ncbi:hypothetical protein GALL_332590 [mine drainage metagenome]|uniref:KfrA N-terminal DNA-binding domain-containing protein n=1 Tax=mine drainage metagenome TaxID=410659 RepID=A0A1J5R5A1_9ZZZZ